MSLLALYVIGLLVWSGCCVWAGQIWEQHRALANDLNERDAWAERYQQEHSEGEAA